MTTKLITILAVLGLLAGCEQKAVRTPQTFNSNGSDTDVQAKHDQAQDGDTITLPSGTFTWKTPVKITKGITLKGNGTVSGGYDTWKANGPPPVCDDKTVIADAVTDRGNGVINCPLSGTDKALRITGLTFKDGGAASNMYNGMLKVSGTSRNVQLDNLHFTGHLKQSNGVAIYGPIRGVAHHVKEDQIDGQNLQNRVYNGTGYGDKEWSEPAKYGTDDFFFFEDWYVDNNNKVFSAGGGWDAHQGGRYVIRNCVLFDVEILCHGTEGDRNRGGRAYEVYNTEQHFSYSTNLDGIRSGSMNLHDNTFVGVKPGGWNTQAYRQIYGYGSGPWKGATGFNAWDYNATAADQSHTDGQPAFVFATGTVTAFAQANPMTMTDSTKSWVSNKWVNYVVSSPATGDTWRITGNGASTIDGRHWGDPNDHQAFSVGQTYKVGYVIQLLDQPCSGASDMPEQTANPTPRWLNQKKEPCYAWNNVHTATGAKIGILTASPGLLVEGRDFFNNTPLPGYTAYVYPHPLVSGGGTTPAPSAVPTATAQPTTPPPSPTVGPTSPAGGIPAAPSALSLTEINTSTVRLDWKDNSNNEEKFFIQTNTNNTGWINYDSVGANTTTFTAGGLQSGKTYGFRVQAQNASGSSSPAEAAITLGGSAPSPSATPPPATPTATAVPTRTPTPVPTPTSTATATATATVPPTPTPTVSGSPSVSPSPINITILPGQTIIITAPTP